MNSKKSTSRFGLHAILVFTVAILVRAWFVVDHLSRLPIMRAPDQDSALYETWAKALLSGVAFTNDVFTMAPGFPMFLSFWYRVAGTDPVAAVLLQCALGVVTTMMVVFLTRRLFGEREAILAGLLYIGVPALYFYETKLLPTTLALWLLVFSLLLLQIAAERKRISLYFLAGLVVGLLVVVRANLLIYAGLVFLGLLWATWKNKEQPKAAALLFAIGIAVAMGPVTAHNLRHGELIPVAANGGLNLYIGNHPDARGVYVDPPGFSGVIMTQPAEADSLVKADVGEVLRPAAENRYWVRRTLESIQAAPGTWLRLEALKLVLLLNREEETNNGSFFFESEQVPWLRLAPVKFNILAALGIIGLFLVVRFPRAENASPASLWPSVSVLIAVLATALLFFIVARFRLYAAPVLAMLGGFALRQGWQYFRDAHWNKFVPFAAAVIVFVGATWVNPLGSGTNRHWESGLLTRSANRLLEQGDREGAKKAFLQALDLSEVRLEAHLGLAGLAAEEGKIPEAIESLEKARSLQPESFPVLNNLTLMYFQARRFEECIGVSEAASILQPEAVNPKLYRALAKKELGDFQGSMDILGVLIQSQPKLAPAYIAAIEIALNTGHRDQAQRAYERALQYEVDLPAEVRAVFEP